MDSSDGASPADRSPAADETGSRGDDASTDDGVTVDEETVGGETIDEERVDEETIDEERVDEETIDEETGDEETADDETADQTQEAAGPIAGTGGRREVEVPPSLYRIVTVFSTLLSILLVVLGFTLLGTATTVVNNPPGSLVVRLLAIVAPMEALVDHRATIAVVVGLAGLASIAAGAAAYVYGSRFRAPGMGKPKDASAEESNDG